MASGEPAIRVLQPGWRPGVDDISIVRVFGFDGRWRNGSQFGQGSSIGLLGEELLVRRHDGAKPGRRALVAGVDVRVKLPRELVIARPDLVARGARRQPE